MQLVRLFLYYIIVKCAVIFCKVFDRNGVVIKRLEFKANSLFEAHDYRRSEQAYAAILLIDSKNQQAFDRLFQIAFESKNLLNAIRVLEKRILNFPDDYFSLSNLVQLSLHLNDLPTATIHLTSAVTLSPESPNTIFLRALLHRHKNELALSNQLLEEVLDQQPTHFQGKLLLANNYVSLNQKALATDALLQLAADYPRAFQPYLELISLKFYKDYNHPHLDQIRQLISDPEMPSEDLANLQHAMGEVLDSLGMYNEAFDHFQRSSAIRRRPFDKAAWSKLTKDLMETFVKEFYYEYQSLFGFSKGSQLIFIIGMPRSGTTLVDQILASHPDVIAHGEDPYFAQMVEKVASSRKIFKNYPACITSWPAEVFSMIADDYQNHVSIHDKNIENLYVNKCLSNIFQVGLLKTIFPGCRFIHCRRNPLDTILSCFFHPLPDIPYSDDLSDLTFVYKNYLKLIEYWSECFSESILHVDYEVFVSKSDASIQSLLEFCGLEWNENCANFYKNTRVVNTTSNHQVKQPIYQSSINRWKNYGSHLGDIIKEFPIDM